MRVLIGRKPFDYYNVYTYRKPRGHYAEGQIIAQIQFNVLSGQCWRMKTESRKESENVQKSFILKFIFYCGLIGRVDSLPEK